MNQWKLKRIPKQVHFYHGDGYQKMSWLRYLSFLSFRVYNPDWKIYAHISDVPYWGKGNSFIQLLQGDILKHLNLERYQSIGPEYVKRMIKNNAKLFSSKNLLNPNCVYKVQGDELDLLTKENRTYTD